MGTLKARLDAVMAGLEDWNQAILADVATHLRATAGNVVLRVGETMPDFMLPNTDGELVVSADLRARGPVVVVFFRGGWCPFCSATLQALQAVLPDIVAAGATLVALTPDTAAPAIRAKRRLGLTFDVLSDMDCATALRFGSAYRVPDYYREMLLAVGTNLAQRHGDDLWLLPLPATFVAGRDGILRHAEASVDVTDRMEPAALVALLGEMAGDNQQA